MSEIINDLNWRYATKEFDTTKKVSAEDLNVLVESLRLSPSSFGLQAWEFVVVENNELKDKLVPFSYNQAQVGQASHVFVLCVPTSVNNKLINDFFEDIVTTRGVTRESLEEYEGYLRHHVGNMNDDEEFNWMKGQLYIALGFLLAAAARLRIDSCPIEGFSPTDYDKLLGLKEKGLRSVLVVPVGYRATTDKYIDIPKVRFSQDKIVTTI